MDKKEKYIYTINGEPSKFVPYRVDTLVGWSEPKQNRIKAIIQLSEQHDFKDKFKKPIDMNIVFYSQEKKPHMLSLMRFVMHILTDSVITRTQIIKDLHIRLVKDQYPRTVIEIIERGL